MDSRLQFNDIGETTYEKYTDDPTRVSCTENMDLVVLSKDENSSREDTEHACTDSSGTESYAYDKYFSYVPSTPTLTTRPLRKAYILDFPIVHVSSLQVRHVF